MSASNGQTGLPDLPELERCDSRTIDRFWWVAAAFCLLFAGGATSFFAWFVIRYWNLLRSDHTTPVALGGLAAFALLDLWLLYKLLFGEHTWSTRQ